MLKVVFEEKFREITKHELSFHKEDVKVVKN